VLRFRENYQNHQLGSTSCWNIPFAGSHDLRATDALISDGASLQQVPSGINNLLRDVMGASNVNRHLVMRFLHAGATMSSDRIHEVLSDCYLYEGQGGNVRFLISKCGRCLHRAPGGINGWLQRVLLEASVVRDHKAEEGLLEIGASFDQCPTPPWKLLEDVRAPTQRAYYRPPRQAEEFLLKNCAALRGEKLAWYRSQKLPGY
jgi:hypothetical protein